MENKQLPLDEDIAMRTVSLFSIGMSREDACNVLSVPVFQEDSWDALWDTMEEANTEVLEDTPVED
jgi:hypothetical protein